MSDRDLKNRRKRQGRQPADKRAENGDISDSLFVRHDWTLFRNIQTIGQKAGGSADRIPRLVAKELVDNALDAGGQCTYDRLDDNGFWTRSAWNRSRDR